MTECCLVGLTDAVRYFLPNWQHCGDCSACVPSALMLLQIQQAGGVTEKGHLDQDSKLGDVQQSCSECPTDIATLAAVSIYGLCIARATCSLDHLLHLQGQGAEDVTPKPAVKESLARFGG